jgi:tRNA A37 N6-isopentenylltransferase MiaA
MDKLEKNQLILHSVALTLAIQILCTHSDESEDFVRKELATLARLIVEQLSANDINRIIRMYEASLSETEYPQLLFIEHEKLTEFLNASHRQNFW